MKVLLGSILLHTLFSELSEMINAIFSWVAIIQIRYRKGKDVSALAL